MSYSRFELIKTNWIHLNYSAGILKRNENPLLHKQDISAFKYFLNVHHWLSHPVGYNWGQADKAGTAQPEAGLFTLLHQFFSQTLRSF